MFGRLLKFFLLGEHFEKGWLPPRQSLIIAITWIFLVSALTVVAHGIGIVKSNKTAIDNFMHLKPLVGRDTFIIGITGDDYEKLFNRKSPLDPTRLLKLIEAVSTGEPKLIVIDLDTSDPIYAGVQLNKVDSNRVQSITYAGKSFPLAHAVPIVWAASVEAEEEDKTKAAPVERLFTNFGKKVEHVWKHITGKEDLPKYRPGMVLGRPAIQSGVDYGVAILPQDSDGLIRHYYREVQDPETGQLHRTLPFQVSVLYGLGKIKPAHKLILNLPKESTDLEQYAAGHLIDEKGLTDMARSGGLKHVIGKDRIAFIGGHYPQARDEYVTPLGTIPGVELVASAVEAELQKQLIYPVNSTFLIVVEWIVGMFFVILFWKFPGGALPELSFMFLPGVAGLVSLGFMRTSSLWVDFAAVIFAAGLHKKLESLWHKWMHAIHATEKSFHHPGEILAKDGDGIIPDYQTPPSKTPPSE